MKNALVMSGCDGFIDVTQSPGRTHFLFELRRQMSQTKKILLMFALQAVAMAAVSDFKPTDNGSVNVCVCVRARSPLQKIKYIFIPSNLRDDVAAAARGHTVGSGGDKATGEVQRPVRVHQLHPACSSP